MNKQWLRRLSGLLLACASVAASTFAYAANTATVYYYSGWTTVNIYYGINGTWTTSPGVAMTKPCTGYWTSVVNLGTATSMATDFNNGTSWDNNNSANYTIGTGITIVKNGVVTSNTTAPCVVDTTPPSVPAGLSVGSATASSLVLSWTASTDNVGVTGYKILRNGTQVGTSTTTSYTNTGLTASTTYSYTVEAYDAAGNTSAASTAASGTTSAGNTAVVYYGNTSNWTTVNINYGINGTWTASPGVAMTLACTGYWTKTVNLGSATSMAVDFDNGTTWDNNNSANYTVNAGTTVVKSGVVTSNAASPCAADMTPPTVPVGLTVGSATSSTLALSWTASTDNIGVSGYKILRNGSQVGTSTTTSYTDTALTASTTYSYTVEAYDAAGNVSAASTAASGTTTVVVNNTAIIYYDNTNNWTAVNIHYGINGTWTVSPGVAMTLACTGYWTKTISLGSATSLAADFDNGTTWDNNGGNNYTIGTGTTVVKSGVVTSNATSPCVADTTPPTVPGTPVVSAITSSGFTVSWSASTDNVGVTGYSISLNGGTALNLTGTSNTFTGLAASTAYTVTVKARDAAGNWSTAATATVTTSAPVDTQAPTTPGVPVGSAITSSSFTATWAASTDNIGVTGYAITLNGGTALNLTGTSNTFTGLTPSTAYTVAVTARDAAGNWSPAAAAVITTAASSDITPPSVPLNPVATVTNTTVVLNWTASTDNVAVTGYQITRSGGTQGTTVLTSTTNSYSDSGLTASTAYVYTIKAFDAAGNYSTASASVTATTGVANTTGVPNTKYYATNPNGQVGAYQTITVDGTGTGFTEANIIAQGVANDDPRIFRGSHEGPVYDLYALYAAWDDTNLYLMWQYTNVTDVADPAQSYPISGNGKPYNGDIPQMLAFNVNNNANGAGGDAVLSTGAGVWGVTVSFPAKNLDHLLMFSSKPGVGTPSVFTLNSSKTFDYTVANTVPFKTAGVFFKYSDAFLPKHMYGINNNGNSGYLPTDLTNTSAFIDFLTTTHSTAQDTVYEMQIPLAALGLTRATLESKGIGVMLVQTFGVSGINFLPYDPTQLDNALLPYSADTSTSHEKEDIDVVSQPFARIGHL